MAVCVRTTNPMWIGAQFWIWDSEATVSQLFGHDHHHNWLHSTAAGTLGRASTTTTRLGRVNVGAD